MPCRRHRQGNNAYVFPGVGLAAVCVKARHLTDEDMYVAARALAGEVSEAQLALGCLYPPLSSIRDVSAVVAAAVAASVYGRGDAGLEPRPADLLAHCRASMYDPAAPDPAAAPAAKKAKL